MDASKSDGVLHGTAPAARSLDERSADCRHPHGMARTRKFHSEQSSSSLYQLRYPVFTPEERSVACLKGLSTGDAIGKQTETLTRSAVQQWYPDGVSGFHGLTGSVIPRYVGRRYEWRVGETTDDTEQTNAVTETLLSEGCVSHSSIGRALMKCLKSNHPDVSLGRFQQRGD